MCCLRTASHNRRAEVEEYHELTAQIEALNKDLQVCYIKFCAQSRV